MILEIVIRRAVRLLIRKRGGDIEVETSSVLLLDRRDGIPLRTSHFPRTATAALIA